MVKKMTINDIFAENTKFSQAEFDALVQCCQYIDITPRTAKRLVNICKILKLIWTPDSHRWKDEPRLEVKQSVIAFLALAGRYPHQMRNVLEELRLRFEQHHELEMIINKEELLIKTQKYDIYRDAHTHRECQKFEYDFHKMPPVQEFILEQRTFNLIVSFCFVGDIGYDPDEGYNYQSTTEKVYGFLGNS